MDGAEKLECQGCGKSAHGSYQQQGAGSNAREGLCVAACIR
jgi:hypothetical protein